MKVLACESCGVLVELSDATIPDNHAGHRGIFIEGETWDHANSVGAKHLELARRMRSDGPFGLSAHALAPEREWNQA